MRYISGLQALKINSGNYELDDLRYKVSATHTLSIYNIRRNVRLPGYPGTYNVANNTRAVLDMINDGKFEELGDFRKRVPEIDNTLEEFFTAAYSLMGNVNRRRATGMAKYIFKYYGVTWAEFLVAKGWRYLGEIGA